MAGEPITVYCKDCRHGVWAIPALRWVCIAPQVQRRLVDGCAPECHLIRENESLCGRVGSWFVEQPAVAPTPPSQSADPGDRPVGFWRRLWRRFVEE